VSAPANLAAILEELTADAQKVDSAQIDKVASFILSAKRVFVAGAGRSGFVARGFANRLMHLGVTAYFVGEPTTPSIQEGDLLIIGSGSGETASLVSMAHKAKKQDASLATLTIYPEKTIGTLADACIVIPGITSKINEATEKSMTIQMTGSSFEQLSWLIYDSLIIDLKRTLGQSEEEMFARHANLE
jgi:6-phospho-3-hexuloisomerase